MVAAIAGLAASSVLVVQRVLDDSTNAPADPLVQALEADVAAAFVASEAQAVHDANPSPPYDDSVFKQRCETGVADDFDEVVDRAEWFSPASNPRARCIVIPKPGLGG